MKINENNSDDLDALYFFDKIDMKPKRALSCDKIIPFLQISMVMKMKMKLIIIIIILSK
jgi:hypothetical protein